MKKIRSHIPLACFTCCTHLFLLISVFPVHFTSFFPCPLPLRCVILLRTRKLRSLLLRPQWSSYQSFNLLRLQRSRSDYCFSCFVCCQDFCLLTSVFQILLSQLIQLLFFKYSADIKSEMYIKIESDLACDWWTLFRLDVYVADD